MYYRVPWPKCRKWLYLVRRIPGPQALLAAYSRTPAGHKCSFIEMCHKLLVCTGTKNGGAAHDAAHELAKHVRKLVGGLVLSQA